MITLDDLNLSAGGDPNSLTIESQPWLGDAQLTWSNGQYAISYTAPDILWRPQQDQFTISVSEPLYGLESETVTVLVDLNPKGYAQYFNVSARRKKRRKKVSGTFFMASGLIPMNPHIFQYITTIGRLKVPDTFFPAILTATCSVHCQVLAKNWRRVCCRSVVMIANALMTPSRCNVTRAPRRFVISPVRSPK